MPGSELQRPCGGGKTSDPQVQSDFSPKASSALTGPYADIVRPREVELLDYEVEFALVLRTGLNATTEVTDGTSGTT